MGMAALSRRVARRLRSKRFIVHWGSMFAGLVALVAALVQLVPSLNISIRQSTLFILLAGVISCVYAWVIARPRQLPAEDILPEGYSARECFAAGCVQDRDRARQVNDLAAEVYPGMKPLPLDRYEQWLMVNPYILTCLLRPGGQVAGYFDVFPLRADFMNILVEGLCGEHDIRREHILSPTQAADTARIYLAGIAVANRDSPQGRSHASMLVWALIKYLQRFYPSPPVRELYAEAATSEGEKLLQKFGFSLAAGAKGRKDPYPLYRVVLTNEALHTMLGNMPDWSTQVRLEWHPPDGAGPIA